MNRLLSYTLTTIGFLTFIFFLNYKGTTIPLKELWFMSSLFIMTVGCYFIVKHKWHNKVNMVIDNERIGQINRLKDSGERIKVTLNNCEIKTRSFQKEVINESGPTRVEMLDALYDSNRSYSTNNIQQTYIVFYRQYGNNTFKFVSQPTSQNCEALKRYIDVQGSVDLYIDKANPNNYYYDLPF